MRSIVAAIISFWLLTVLPALAQGNQTTRVVPDDHPRRATGEAAAAPAKPTPRVTLRTHNFFDRRNSLAIGTVAASLAGDAWSTQRALALPGTRELNPVARPFVGSRSGEAAYSAASLGLVAGAMYVAHRTNHHKWERIAPFVLAGWEGVLTGWNLHEASQARANH